MKRFRVPWLVYLFRRDAVDFSALAAERVPDHLLVGWLRDAPADGRVHVSPGGVGFLRTRV